MLEKIISWFRKNTALRRMRRNAAYDIVITEVTKDWVTRCIIDRKQEGRRNELIDAQKKLQEQELFYKFLKNYK